MSISLIVFAKWDHARAYAIDSGLPFNATNAKLIDGSNEIYLGAPQTLKDCYRYGGQQFRSITYMTGVHEDVCRYLNTRIRYVD